MITGEQLIDAVQNRVGVLEEVGMESFLTSSGVEPDALRVLVRGFGSDIVEGSQDVHGVIVQAVILGFLAGWGAHVDRVPA